MLVPDSLHKKEQQVDTQKYCHEQEMKLRYVTTL